MLANGHGGGWSLSDPFPCESETSTWGAKFDRSSKGMKASGSYDGLYVYSRNSLNLFIVVRNESWTRWMTAGIIDSEGGVLEAGMDSVIGAGASGRISM